MPLNKKELRSPDGVLTIFYKLSSWVQSYWLALVVVLGLSVVGVFAGTIYYQHRQGVEKEAHAHFSEAQRLYEQWELEPGVEKLETLESLEEKLETLETEYPRTQANQLANLFRARIANEDDDVKRAISFYQSYVHALPRQRKFLGLYPLALLYEDEEEWKKSLETYSKILEAERQAIKKQALLGKGRALRKLGREEEAIDIYREFMSEFPASSQAPMVEGWLAQFEER